MTAVIVGIGFIVIGLWGISHWFQPFLFFMRAFVPLSFLLGGVVSLVVGIASLRPNKISDSHGDEK